MSMLILSARLWILLKENRSTKILPYELAVKPELPSF